MHAILTRLGGFGLIVMATVCVTIFSQAAWVISGLAV